MLPLVKKPDTIIRLCEVDIEPLVARMKMLSEKVWDAENARKENNFECFHNTRHIIFRFIHANADPLNFYSTPAWPVWRPLVQPLIDKAVATYGFAKPEFPKAMLARLEAGNVIDRHVDGAGSNLRTHKIHIPLITNPGAIFMVGDTEQNLEPGWAYEVNNIKPHGVRNDGDEDRFHLIFEVFDMANAQPVAESA